MEHYIFVFGINDGLGAFSQSRKPRARATTAKTLEEALEKVRPQARAVGSPVAEEYVQYRLNGEELEKVGSGTLKERLY